MAIEIVGLPINSMVIFHRFLLVYQRVFPLDVPLQNAGFTATPAAGEKDCLAANDFA